MSGEWSFAAGVVYGVGATVLWVALVLLRDEWIRRRVMREERERGLRAPREGCRRAGCQRWWLLRVRATRNDAIRSVRAGGEAMTANELAAELERFALMQSAYSQTPLSHGETLRSAAAMLRALEGVRAAAVRAANVLDMEWGECPGCADCTRCALRTALARVGGG